MKIRLLLVMMSLLIGAQSWAQGIGQLRGTVVDDTGNVLVGATVNISDPNDKQIAHHSTDQQGVFTFTDLQSGVRYVVRVTMMGYEDYQINSPLIKEGDSNSLLIRMEKISSSLDEVVVIGYGEQRRQNLTTAVGSMANIKANTERPISGVGEMLQGNVAGVTVMSAGGDPSTLPKVMIRGMGTLNNDREDPLYVVDGVPYYGGPINPNDIEKIDILKDAAAAAIYGAQAGSGVILITTKSGKLGKPRFDVDFYQGWHQASNLPSALNAAQYAQAYTQASEHAGKQVASGHDPDLNPWGQVTRTDWMDAIFRTGNITNANIQASGGGEKSRYSTSFGYHNKEGLLLNTNYERFAYRLKSEFELSERFTLGQNFYANYSKSRGADTESSYSGTIINAIYMNPAAPIYDENGLFHGTVPSELAQFSGAYGDTYNPVALLLRPTVSNPTLNLNGNAYASFCILEGLTFKSNFAVDIKKYSYERFDPKIPEIGRSTTENYLAREEQNTKRWLWDQQLNFTRSFGQHHLDLLAVYSAQHTSYDQYYIQGKGFAREDDWFQYIRNAAELEGLPQSDVWEDALTSAIARASYDYADRYFLSASIRTDRSSRLAEANRSDTFPSVSGAWKISSEPFFKSSMIDLLKVRSSWGQIGNIQSVDPYAFDVPLDTKVNTPLGSGLVRHYALVQPSNPLLKWERSESFNIGLDLGLFNKLTLSADYYRKKTIGMLKDNEVDPHAGIEKGAIVNAGDVRNTGVEFVATYTDQSGDWRWSANANIGINKNELLNLDGYSNSFISHSDLNVRSVLYPYRSNPGQPLASFYLIPHDGIFQSDAEVQAYSHNGTLIQPNARAGDLRFVDTNGDGVINDNDRIFMGSALPKVTYGFNIQTSYKDFDLNITTYGISGSQVFNGYKYTAFNAGLQGYNLDSRVLDAWTSSHTDTDIPVLSTSDPNNNFGTASDWYLEDGDFFRIKNIALGYTLPANLLQKVGKGLRSRIYVSAENPFTFTSYDGIDPEVGLEGLDVGNYPLPKTYTVGISVNF